VIEIHPLAGIGEVGAAVDLASLLGESAGRGGLTPFAPGDVIVVTQKVVSKSEDRWRDLGSVVAGPEALRLAGITGKDSRFIQAVLDESAEVLRAAPNVLIARHRHGFVMANAGVDRSNVGPARQDLVLLLPEDPDRSAARLHARMGVAIVISDSVGRPWRNGVTAIALGASGLPSLLDKRGELDREGRRLEVTQVALADLLASAAALAMGEAAEGIPAVLVRGCAWTDVLPAAAARLVRPLAEDLFR
jgi:coenzyme F420-0:L-glutamate ligase/coenzyme F420-1:gamma-L-glutamate ligase